MAINFEVKGMLAKLLAAENLIIEHQKVETPSFDVTNRVLTLPLWDKASNDVYDLLVSHEVGHALYTPDEDWGEVPFQFVNVVEDVRIEKLIKRKFAGLSKTFYNGYGELHKKDFFEIESVDVKKLNLADRINLDAKIGNFIKIPFKNKVEGDIYGVIKECETFDDVRFASKLLYKYCVDQLEKKVENKIIEPDTDEGKDFVDEFFDEGESKPEILSEPEVETSESFEGIGDHGCEYMTGGKAIILGLTGRNFGAGMSGGVAFVYDLNGDFETKCNKETFELEKLSKDDLEDLKQFITKHRDLTGSEVAKFILDSWNNEITKFVKVMPTDYKRVLNEMKEGKKASNG